MSDFGPETALAPEPVSTAQAHESRREVDVARLEELFTTLSALCHQINNPLTSMLGRAQILQMNKSLDPAGTKAVTVIEDSAKRVAHHVRDLAAVVRAGRERLLPGSAAGSVRHDPSQGG